MQCYDTARDAWSNLQKRYVSNTVNKRLEQLNNLLNNKQKKDLEMVDHIRMMESQFAQRAAIGATVE